MSGPAGPIGSTENPLWLRPLSQGGRALLELLLKEGPSSQASMAGRLGLSQPSIARLVGDFREQELVTLSERRAEGRGNPSVLVNLNPDFAYGLGVSLAGDAVSLCLLDLQGRVRAAETQAMATMDRASVIDAIKAVRARVLRKARVDAARIAGAGVAFSGFFVGPPLRFNPPRQLEAWSTLDVAAELREVLGVSVVAENDGSAAAVAEALLGVGRRCSTFAYCNLTNGFGGGLMDHGRLVRGFLGNAGDFGGVVWLLGGAYPASRTSKRASARPERTSPRSRRWCARSRWRRRGLRAGSPKPLSPWASWPSCWVIFPRQRRS